MNKLTFAKTLAITTASAFIWAAPTCTSLSVAHADVNIGALACQPPFLDQAKNLRWHEHYIYNPKKEDKPDSIPTWVVCPLAFESTMVPDTFTVGVFGNHAVPGNTVQCYLNVVDLRNQDISQDNFLVNPGQSMIYRKILQTQNTLGTLWAATASVSINDIINSMMDPQPSPVDPSGTSVGIAYWTITVNCELKPGSAINMISLY